MSMLMYFHQVSHQSTFTTTEVRPLLMANVEREHPDLHIGYRVQSGSLGVAECGTRGSTPIRLASLHISDL